MTTKPPASESIAREAAEIQRYEVGTSVVCNNGAWVTYNDHVAALSKHAEEVQAENERLREESQWVRKKLGLPPETEFLTGETSLAGTMHVVCSHADGYMRYIAAFKCDDKQGEIARQSVEITALQAELADLRRRVGEAGK